MIADLSRPYRRQRVHWDDRLRLAAVGLAVALGTLALMLWLAAVAYGGSAAAVQTVVVHPGDTVWSIAAAHYRDPDLRGRVDQIITANHLTGPILLPGETLRLPPE